MICGECVDTNITVLDPMQLFATLVVVVVAAAVSAFNCAFVYSPLSRTHNCLHILLTQLCWCMVIADMCVCVCCICTCVCVCVLVCVFAGCQFICA